MSVTPTPDGGDTPESDRWEKVGRQLLTEQLELAGLHVQQAFDRAAGCVDGGGELSEDDVEKMRDALEDAKHAAEIAAEASPEADPMPDLSEFLGKEGRAELAQAAEQRLDKSEEGSE